MAILGKIVEATWAIFNSNDRDGLLKAIDDSSTSFGFNHFHLACHKATKQEAILDSTLTSVPQDYLADYERFQWSDSDFIIDRAFSSDESFFWDDSTNRHEDVQNRSFVDYLYANRMSTGIMAPMKHRPGTASNLSFICNTSGKFGPEMIDATTIVGNAAMMKAEILGLCPEISIDEATAVRSLTDVQAEVLNWIAEGKSNLDIGTIMNLEERTVRYHVSKILQKLGVATRTQAAVIRRSVTYDPRSA